MIPLYTVSAVLPHFTFKGRDIQDLPVQLVYFGKHRLNEDIYAAYCPNYHTLSPEDKSAVGASLEECLMPEEIERIKQQDVWKTLHAPTITKVNPAPVEKSSENDRIVTKFPFPFSVGLMGVGGSSELLMFEDDEFCFGIYFDACDGKMVV